VRQAVIISAVRTPVGRYMGALRDIPAYDLAALVLDEVLKRCGARAEAVDEVIFGQSYQSGEYVNVARMALLKAGWPESIPGVTVDCRCCTGLDTVRMAAMMIQSEQAAMVVAGGAESMSTAEFYICPGKSSGASEERAPCLGGTVICPFGVCACTTASKGRGSCRNLRSGTGFCRP